MNVHAALDRSAAVAGALALDSDRFFARVLRSPPIDDVVRRVELAPVESRRSAFQPRLTLTAAPPLSPRGGAQHL